MERVSKDIELELGIMEKVVDSEADAIRKRREIIIGIYRKWHNGDDPSEERITEDSEFLDRCQDKLTKGWNSTGKGKILPKLEAVLNEA